jgi:hypothetical protein
MTQITLGLYRQPNSTIDAQAEGSRFARIRVGFFFARRARSAVSARDWGGIFNSRSKRASRRCSGSSLTSSVVVESGFFRERLGMRIYL